MRLFCMGGLMVCFTCVWAGVDSAWVQGKLEARKMLLNRADSHTLGVRFVRRSLTFRLLELLLLIHSFSLAKSSILWK